MKIGEEELTMWHTTEKNEPANLIITPRVRRGAVRVPEQRR